MADNDDSQAVIDPGKREGRTVGIVDDGALIVRAFREGWIDSIDLADDLLDDAIADVSAVRSTAHNPAVLAQMSMHLASVAQGAANMRTRAIQVALEQATAKGATNNVQVNIYESSSGEDLSKLSDDELDARIERARRAAARAEAPKTD